MLCNNNNTYFIKKNNGVDYITKKKLPRGILAVDIKLILIESIIDFGTRVAYISAGRILV